MLGRATSDIVAIMTAIVILATIAVVFGSKETAPAINSATGALAALLTKAVSPVQP